ncbi:hypothetical protein BH09BAC1_BH09BAC1_20620 [soil metagenome]
MWWCGSLMANDYKLLYRQPVKGTVLTSDKFGSAYVITTKKELIKFDPIYNRFVSYSLVKFGQPTHIDASNPLKVMLFFNDYDIIVFLDNTLSEKAVIRLQNRGPIQVDVTCLALDNNIWIYDELVYKLRKIDEQSNIIRESDDLSLLFNASISPNFLLEADNRLFVNVPDRGVQVFDLFGAFSQTIPLKGLDNFQVFMGQMVYFQNGKLYSYNLQTFDTRPIPLPEVAGTILDIHIQNERLLVLTENELLVYSY